MAAPGPPAGGVPLFNHVAEQQGICILSGVNADNKPPAKSVRISAKQQPQAYPMKVPPEVFKEMAPFCLTLLNCIRSKKTKNSITRMKANANDDAQDQAPHGYAA